MGGSQSTLREPPPDLLYVPVFANITKLNVQMFGISYRRTSKVKIKCKKKQDEKDEERGRRGNAHHTKSNLKMTITKN